MKKLFGVSIMIILLLRWNSSALCQEKPAAKEKQEDPITAIVTAPFKMIGAMFNPENYEYNPDEPDYWSGYYGRYSNWDPWWYWDYDPYYDWYRNDRRYYRYHRYPYSSRYYRYYRYHCD